MNQKILYSDDVNDVFETGMEGFKGFLINNGQEAITDDALSFAWDDYKEVKWEELLSKINSRIRVQVTGLLEMWDGVHSINPVMMEADRAIEKCAQSGIVKVVKINDDEIQVEVTHHDGKNIFNIKSCDLKYSLLNE